MAILSITWYYCKTPTVKSHRLLIPGHGRKAQVSQWKEEDFYSARVFKAVHTGPITTLIWKC